MHHDAVAGETRLARSTTTFGGFLSASMALYMVCILASPAAAQLRVVSYNIAHLLGDDVALQAVLEAIHADDKPGFAVPISVIMFQEVQNANLPALQSIITATAPPGVTYLAATYTNNNEDGSAGAQAMFYRSDLLTEQVAAHADIYTQASRNADRWLLKLNGYTSLQAWFYVYSSHLKSDTGGANEQLRLQGVQAIRSNAASLGGNAHIIYAGDQNFYNNTEPGYLHYLSGGFGQAIDPLGAGSWAGGSQANNLKHTQSPLLTPANGLAGGGMDDRFDFQLITAAFNDSNGLSMIPGTYRSFGNDGLHLDQAINNGNNFYYPADLPRSNALSDILIAATDHIPVIVDFQIPAVMNATMDADVGRVIEGADLEVPVQVTNAAGVDFVIGADELVYSATASGALSGVSNDTVLALGDVSEPAFALDTTMVGVRNGSVQLTSASQGVQNSSILLNTTGIVVRHANASFDSRSDIDQLSIPLEIESGTGTHIINVDIHNLGFNADQALLDVDSVSPVTPPFAFISGLTGGIGAVPAMLSLSFDSDGLADGRYNINVTIETSDEDLPGAASANLLLSITVNVGTVAPCPADIDGSGAVNIDDLLVVINAWGNAGTPGTVTGDVDGNGVVNIDDLLAVISAWGACD
jgi:hypothetical protein